MHGLLDRILDPQGLAAFDEPRVYELTGQRSGSEALRLLDERYARGELGRDEYLERKTDLSGI